MKISVKNDIKQLTRRLHSFADQIPFATSVSLNKTVFEARENTQGQIIGDIDRPTGYTLRGVRYKNSNKRNLTASVFFTPETWRYMKYQVSGGIRKPQRFAIAVPANVKRNQYGNPARGAITRLLARPDTFSATIRGTSGIWQRMRSGGLKLLYHYQPSVKYKPGRFKYAQAVSDTVRRRFNKHFEVAIRKAIKTARL